jgi:hypothetical protein
MTSLAHGGAHVLAVSPPMRVGDNAPCKLTLLIASPWIPASRAMLREAAACPAVVVPAHPPAAVWAAP